MQSKHSSHLSFAADHNLHIWDLKVPVCKNQMILQIWSLKKLLNHHVAKLYDVSVLDDAVVLQVGWLRGAVVAAGN